MENSTTITLIIKAANQKSADFTVDCELDWTVRYLKLYLSKNYPTKPNEKTIRLIYSGKQLNDESQLKDCIRLNSETNVHNIHMVYKQTTPINEDEYSSSNQANVTDRQTSEVLNETVRQIINQQNVTNFEQMTPKQQHQLIYNQLRNYYSSMGVAMSNSWNISYLHHTALYYQMYSNYMRSIGVNPTIDLHSNLAMNNSSANVDANNNNENAPNNQPAAAQANNNVDAELRAAEEREDDWLSILHNLCSFFVLFSIVYFYSTFTRFMIVFVTVVLLMLYHGGWFALERRNGRNDQRQNQQAAPQANQDNNNNQDINNNNNNANANPTNTENETTPAAAGPNMFRIVFSFIVTFFTSLIPERARIPN